MLGSGLLSGPRVRLCRLERADAAAVASWYADPEFMRLFGAEVAFPKSEAQIGAEIDAASRSTKCYLFGVRTVEDDRLIGRAAVEDVLWQHGVAWLSIALDHPYWGQGYGSEALDLLLRFAFTEMNLHRLQLTVFDYNERARVLYKRFGFRREGVFRQFLLRDGKRHDMLLMGLLAREWQAEQGGGDA